MKYTTTCAGGEDFIVRPDRSVMHATAVQVVAELNALQSKLDEANERLEAIMRLGSDSTDFAKIGERAIELSLGYFTARDTAALAASAAGKGKGNG